MMCSLAACRLITTQVPGGWLAGEPQKTDSPQAQMFGQFTSGLQTVLFA
jgi:hypothetical protein